MKPLNTPINIKKSLRVGAMILVVSVSVGLFIALFLGLLDRVGELRWKHLWIIGFLPAAGILIYLLYSSFEKKIDERMPVLKSPLLMFSTLITHLFGGSAGRESAATKMGEGLADVIANRFNCTPDELKLMLRCGAAAGFGAVFGTPFTGAIFAVEGIRIQDWTFKYLLPCLCASFAADAVCQIV